MSIFDQLPPAKRTRYCELKARMRAGERIPDDDFKFVKGIDMATRAKHKDNFARSNYGNSDPTIRQGGITY